MATPPGTRVGPYEILEQPDAGGMGEVHKATDTRRGPTVAVKFLHEAHTERFQREARAIAVKIAPPSSLLQLGSLRHPTIAIREEFCGV